MLPEQTTPPLNVAVPIEQSHLSDSFDARSLLKLVPEKFKQKAATLLKIFEQRPYDITFDTKGVLFVNGESIPNSSFKKLFPALFKKRSKSLTGLSELRAKLDQMRLLHLISGSHTPHVTVGSGASTSTSKSNWWYLK